MPTAPGSRSRAEKRPHIRPPGAHQKIDLTAPAGIGTPLDDPFHERFAVALAAGRNGRDAYAAAGGIISQGAAGRAMASRLRNSAPMVARVAELKGLMATRTIERVVDNSAGPPIPKDLKRTSADRARIRTDLELLFAVAMGKKKAGDGRKHVSLSVAARALTLLGRDAGLWERENMGQEAVDPPPEQVEVRDMGDDQLAKHIQGLLEAEGATPDLAARVARRVLGGGSPEAEGGDGGELPDLRPGGMEAGGQPPLRDGPPPGGDSDPPRGGVPAEADPAADHQLPAAALQEHDGGGAVAGVVLDQAAGPSVADGKPVDRPGDEGRGSDAPAGDLALVPELLGRGDRASAG